MEKYLGLFAWPLNAESLHRRHSGKGLKDFDIAAVCRVILLHYRVSTFSAL